MWACAWLDYICAWVQRVKVVFSPGYVLLSFSILTLSSRWVPSSTQHWTQVKPSPDRPEKILFIKEVGGRKATTRRRGMNQNSLNPGLTLEWFHPCSLLIEWSSRGCLPNVNLRPRVVLDTQVWLPARDGVGRDALCWRLYA